MEEQVTIESGTVAQARELVASLEEGDSERAAQALDELTKIREAELFQEVGRLTRQLHDTLVSVQADGKLSTLARKDMPDAKERLSHVIEMTETAAHKTMASIEKTMPLCESLNARSVELTREWNRFMSRELGVEEFRELARGLGAFLAFSEEQSGAIQAGLREILIAQDYQDLTGQTIKRVIQLVQEVESSLVEMIRFTGPKIKSEEDAPARDKDTTSVNGQDEVDDLLSSLGF